jgi:hypothetical protein
MFARKLPKPNRLRRQVRRAALRTLRVLRRHHLSLISAAVLAVAAVFALSGTSFETRAAAPSEAVVLPLQTAPATATARSVPPQATPAPDPPSFIYYFIDSQEKLSEIHGALHRDLVDEALISYKPLHNVTRIFILIEDSRDEAEALELLRQHANAPPNDGSTVRVVDLR